MTRSQKCEMANQGEWLIQKAMDGTWIIMVADNNGVLVPVATGFASQVLAEEEATYLPTNMRISSPRSVG